MKAPADAPTITTLREAEAIGIALAQHSPIDPKWAVEIFQSSTRLTYVSGPRVLNAELASMWKYVLTNQEKINIMTAYVAARLDG